MRLCIRFPYPDLPWPIPSLLAYLLASLFYLLSTPPYHTFLTQPPFDTLRRILALLTHAVRRLSHHLAHLLGLAILRPIFFYLNNITLPLLSLLLASASALLHLLGAVLKPLASFAATILAFLTPGFYTEDAKFASWLALLGGILHEKYVLHELTPADLPSFPRSYELLGICVPLGLVGPLHALGVDLFHAWFAFYLGLETLALLALCRLSLPHSGDAQFSAWMLHAGSALLGRAWEAWKRCRDEREVLVLLFDFGHVAEFVELGGWLVYRAWMRRREKQEEELQKRAEEEVVEWRRQLEERQEGWLRACER